MNIMFLIKNPTKHLLNLKYVFIGLLAMENGILPYTRISTITQLLYRQSSPVSADTDGTR